MSCSSTRRALGYSRGMALASRSELAGDLDALEALDLDLHLHVVVALDANATFGAGAHFGRIILEPLERLELALKDHDVVTQHAHRVVPAHIALDHEAPGHGAELARAENLANFGKAHDLLLDLRREHAGQCGANVIDRLVNDAVVADLDVLVAHRF